MTLSKWTREGNGFALAGGRFRVEKKRCCVRRWRVFQLKRQEWIDIGGYMELSAAQKYAETETIAEETNGLHH